MSRLDLQPGLLDQPLDPRRSRLLVGLRNKNDVAVQLDVPALHLHSVTQAQCDGAKAPRGALTQRVTPHRGPEPNFCVFGGVVVRRGQKAVTSSAFTHQPT